jgi:hypothetical protein
MKKKNCVRALALFALTLDAQQPTPLFKFKPLTSTGTTIGRYTLAAETGIEGVAVNSNGEIAFVVSHLPMGKSFGSAVMTPERIIALTYDHVGGAKTLLDISGMALAIDDQRHVYYESSFQDGETTRLGIFRDKEFLFVVNGSGAADDFTVTPDGRVVPRAGAITSPVPTTTRSLTPITPRPQQASGVPSIFTNPTLSDQTRRQIAKRFGIVLPPNPLAQPPQQQQRPQPAAPTPRPATPVQQQPARPAAPCTLPAFPLPADWIVGGESKGPITSTAFDAPGGKPRAYESPFFGHMGSPFRTILYADCVPQVIVVGDATLHGKFEFWTPNGLLTYTRPDGFLELPGFMGRVLPTTLARRDAPVQINRRGQVAFLVSLDPEGYAIILATPTGR